MEKILSNNFHIWKKAGHRNFIQFSVRMNFYGKKFFIYENCMIKNLGHFVLYMTYIKNSPNFKFFFLNFFYIWFFHVITVS